MSDPLHVPAAPPSPAVLDDTPPAGLTRTQAAALDAPATLAMCTRWETAADGTPLARTRLLLDGLYCAACAGLIEAALLREPGVCAARVQAVAQRAEVVWSPAATRASRLVAAVQRAGYRACPDGGTPALSQAEQADRRTLWQLFVAGIAMMQIMMYAAPAYVAGADELGRDTAALLRWASWLLCLPVLLFASRPFFSAAWAGLRQRRIVMDLPVALGIAVTFVASSAAGFQAGDAADTEVYFDSLSMFVTFLLGARLLEQRARRRAAQALDAVTRRLPDAVDRLNAGGVVQTVTVAELAPGDRVRVQAGQAFPADGVLLEGRTTADEALLTGESRPQERGPGEAVCAGSLNLGAPVLMRVDALGAQTRYQRIVDLVGDALLQRPALLRSVDRLAAPFLWAVLALAALAWLGWQFIDPSRATWVAVAVLVVTCPCALSLGAPVALLSAAGALARRGVLVQRLDALEVLSRVQHLALDKTGTLTEDRLQVRGWQALAGAAGTGGQPAPDGWWRATELAAQSRHPLSRALAATRGAADGTQAAAAEGRWLEVEERPGEGLQGRWQPAQGPVQHWRLGSAAWCAAGAVHGDHPLASPSADAAAGPVVWVAEGGPVAHPAAPHPADLTWQPCLRIDFDENLRPDAASGVAALRARSLQLHLLSGDQPAAVARLARRLGLDDARAACTPADKLAALAAWRAGGAPVAMLGDGINDAPVLAGADVAIAMGSGAALAQARADLVVLGNRIGDVALALDTARRAIRVVRQNLAWALAYNLACVPLALAGWLPPWAAGLGMAGSSLLVVLNGLRLARLPDDPPVQQLARPAVPNVQPGPQPVA